MCRLLLEHHYSFILTCKYISHSYLDDWIKHCYAKTDLHEKVVKRWDRRLFYRYRLIRATLPRRDRFFHDLKALTQYFLFDSWVALLRFMLDGLDLEDPGG